MLRPDTVRTHVGRAMTKLHARNRAQLVLFAVRVGMILPDDRRLQGACCGGHP